MNYVLTNGQMRAADEYTIKEKGVPSLTLMERAGRALADEVEREMRARGIDDALCVCGGGNNGGDGFVCARILSERGYEADVLCTAERLTDETAAVKAAFEKAGGRTYALYLRRRYAIVVDCVCGTGFSGELRGKNAELAAYINRSGAFVISADIPSGVNGENGRASQNAVRADLTVCIGEYKAGVFLRDGLDYAGRTVCARIGIEYPEGAEREYAFLSDEESVKPLLPERRRNTHKGVYGKAAVVGGSEKYAGAAFLAAKAALRSGAGYTALFAPSAILPACLLRLPEVLLRPLCDGGRVALNEKAIEELTGYDAVAFGMGAECSEATCAVALAFLERFTGTLILDADALNALAAYGRVSVLKRAKGSVVITPHAKEFSRLTGLSVEEILDGGLSSAQAFAREYGVTVLLKGATTIVADGKRTAVNIAGSAGQAKGGSGDVLSGVIAALCAGGRSAFDGARAGAYLAGRAAELCAAERGTYSMLPSDVIEKLSEAFKEILR